MGDVLRSTAYLGAGCADVHWRSSDVGEGFAPFAGLTRMGAAGASAKDQTCDHCPSRLSASFRRTRQ